MSQFNSFDEKRHTAIYVRISTASQKTDLSKRKRSLMEIRDEKKLMLKMDEIMADQNRVKEYIHEYVTQIVLYKPDPS